MQGIEIKGFDELTKDLDNLLKKLPQKRRELHEKVADVLKQEVDKNISSSLDDGGGKIRGWQDKHVGSGGGYAAVRAQKGETGAKSPGAITNYLESGHKIRRPTGTNKRYYPRIKVPYVDGRHFYRRTRENIEGKLIALVEDFAEDIAKEVEG